jgi:hypothetical protein
MPTISASREIMLNELRAEFADEKYIEWNHEMTEDEIECLDDDNNTVFDISDYVEGEYNRSVFSEDNSDVWCKTLAEYKEWENYYNEQDDIRIVMSNYTLTIQMSVYSLMKEVSRVFLRELNEHIKKRKIDIFIRHSPVMPDLTKMIISYL